MTSEAASIWGIANACVNCGAGTFVAYDASRHDCAVCDTVKLFRRCPDCDRAFFIRTDSPTLDAGVTHWICPGCGRQRLQDGFLPARAESVPEISEVKDWISEHYGQSDIVDALSNQDRRLIFGAVLAAPGWEFTYGDRADVIFDRNAAVIFLGSDVNRPISEYSRRTIAFADITALLIGTRSDVVDGRLGAGGFGPADIIAGDVQNTILQRKWPAKSSETILHLQWTHGSVTLLNLKLSPRQWVERLAPVLRRLAEREVRRGSLGPQGSALFERAATAAARVARTEAARSGWLGDPEAIDFSEDLAFIEANLRAANDLTALIAELSALPDPSSDEKELIKDAQRRVSRLEDQSRERVTLIEKCVDQAKLIDQSLHGERENARIADKRAELSGRMAATIYGIDVQPQQPASSTADKITGLVAAFQDVKNMTGSA